MPIQVVKDPQTGEERRVYVPPSGMGETTTPAKPKAQPQPQPQRQSQPSFGLADLTGALPIFGMMNQLQITGGSIGAAVREYQRSGDLGKAYQAGQKQYIKELEQPGRAAQRVPAMAGRNIAQEVSDVVTADLPAALGVPGAKPTTAKRPDAPFLGVMPALPKAKSSSPAEDIATGIVQAGVEWFPAARAVGLVGKGARLLPGAAKVAGAVRGATKAAAATKAAQAVSKVPGAAVVGKALAKNTITKVAATGALVDVAGFDQYGGRLTDLIDNAVKGTPLEGITLDYLKSDPNDVGMDGRLKNALEGGLFGTVLEVAFRTLRVARNYNWWRRAPEEQKPAAEEGLKQATQDLETEVAKQAYTVPDPWGPGTVPNLPGAARPTNQALRPPARTEVAEVNVDAIQTDPKRFQFKAEGRKAEGGVAAPITDEQGFNPLKGGVVSAWTDPADGVTYVVNGHSRLAAAKESGYDKILVRQIQAETAEEARRVGALQNISEGQVTPKDAGTFVRQSGMTAQDMAAEGISLDNPAIAKQVDAEVKAAPAAQTQFAEPPVPEGMTRLYHGSREWGRYDGPAWFSTNREYAANYRANAELQYVDVPTERINKLADPDNYGQTPAAGFTYIGEFDSTDVGLRKPIPTTVVEATPLASDVITPEVLPPESTVGSGTKRPLSQQLRERMQDLGQNLADATRTMDRMTQRYEQSLADRIDKNQAEMAEMGLESPSPQGLPATSSPTPQISPAAEPSVPSAGSSAAATPSTPRSISAIDGQLEYNRGPFQAVGSTDSDGVLRGVVDVGGPEDLPADFLQSKGVTDIAAASAIRKTSLLREFAEGEFAKLPPGEYLLDADPQRLRIYRKWFLEKDGFSLQDDNLVFTKAPAAEPSVPSAGSSASAVEADLPDTRGQGEYFHGTAREITQLDEGYYESRNVYGQGFYATDDLKTAGSYTKKDAKAIKKEGGDVQQNVYRVQEVQPVRFYDLDAPVDPKVKAYLDGIDWSESVDRAMGDTADDPNISLAKLMDEIRANSRSAGESRDTIQEVFDGIRETLAADGYGGFTHVGGKLTKAGREHQVRIYWDPANQITVEKVDPAAQPSVPSAGTSAAAPAPTTAGPTAAEIAELDRTLAQARADLPPQQRVALRNQVLAQKYATAPEVTPAAAAPEPTLSSAPDQVDLPPEPGRTEPTLGGSGGEPPAPPPAVVEPPSFDEGWAQQLVRQMEQQRQGLEEGTITMDDLLENNVQKIVSPSGATSYVASPPTSATQAYRAFSDVFTRPDATGIPVMSFERVQKDTEAWLSKVGYDGQAVLENLKQLSGPLGNYQENLVALRAAQLYADHSNLQAGIAANKWLNAAADESVDVGQLTAELLTAAAQQKAANLALESVTRPIGQLLYSLQNPRPTPGSLPFDEGLPPTKDLGKELEDALEVEAQTPVSESIGKALSPEAEEAILTGNYTPQVLAEVDQLARNMAQSAVTPGFAKGFWRQVNDSVAIGARGLVIYRASQLLSSGLTLWSNAINGVFRLVQMPLSQALGAAAQMEFSRVAPSLMMYGQYVSNLQNALRLGVESFKAGRGLYDLDQTSVDFLDKMAKQDLESTLLPPAVDRKAEWDLNTMPWLDVQDKSVWAIAQKRLWQTLNLSTRTQVSIDTFFKVLAGQSYEYVRNLQPGMDRAIQQGLTPGSKEAWQFAKEYAQAAVDRATRDVAIDGRTILDAVMTSPQAQAAMRYATFTDDIWAEMGPKTYEGGMQLAKAKGLEGAAAEEAVRKYLEAPAEVPFFGRTFSMMPAAWQKLIDFSPLFSIIQPFNRTPGDLVKSAARMGGLTAPLVDTWWRDLNSEDAFTRDRAIGDMAVGMAAISLGTIAMTHGRLQFTGGGPANPEAKKKWRDEGNQPYSFRVRTGDEWSPWVSMRVFEPLSTVFGAMADYQEIANKIPKEARERLGSALGMDLMLAVAAGQLSKTYYQGFSELYEVAMGVGEVDVGPNKRNPAERYVSRILASMVPASSALRAGRRIEDPIVRDIPPSPVEGGLQGLPMRLFQETLGEIRNMIPGWSESLPPRRNWITGEPIVLSGILGDQYLPPDQPWLSTVFQFVPWSPFQVAPKQDPVLVEMAKLSGKGANFRGPQPTDWGRELRLDPVQFDQYVQTASNVKDQFGRTIYQALNDLINSDYYKSLPDEEVSTTVMSQKAAAIDLEVQKFRKLGKEAFEANNPALVRDLRNIEGLNKDVQYRLKYGQPIDVNRFTEALR